MNESHKFWDFIARRSNVQSHPLKGVARKTIENCEPFLKPTDSVLDIGSGMGEMSLAIAESVNYVTAYDTSKGMVAVAKSLAESTSIKNVSFNHGTGINQVADNQLHDVITIFNVLHFILDHESYLSELKNQLKTGGLLITSTACVADRFSWLRLLTRLASSLSLIPQIHFFRSNQLDENIGLSGFKVIVSKNLSTLPDHFVVAQKLA